MSQLSAVPGMKVHTNNDGTQARIPDTVVVGGDKGSPFWAADPALSADTVYISPMASVGENVKILRDSEIMEGATIGEGARIGRNVHVAPYAKVPSYWIIPSNHIVNRAIGTDPDAPPFLVKYSP